MIELPSMDRSNSTSSATPLGAGRAEGSVAASGPPATEGWIEKREFLLVVVTLITTLTYPLSASRPGGFWQDDKKGDHVAGDPIMRDKSRGVYNLLVVVNWLSFYNSLVLTVWLLSGVPAKSKRIKWSFLFSYTCLVFTYHLPFLTGHISDPDVGIALGLSILSWICFVCFAYLTIFSAN